jgi:hypothetical protein
MPLENISKPSTNISEYWYYLRELFSRNEDSLPFKITEPEWKAMHEHFSGKHHILSYLEYVAGRKLLTSKQGHPSPTDGLQKIVNKQVTIQKGKVVAGRRVIC